jgi:hypothetical protein
MGLVALYLMGPEDTPLMGLEDTADGARWCGGGSDKRGVDGLERLAPTLRRDGERPSPTECAITLPPSEFRVAVRGCGCKHTAIGTPPTCSESISRLIGRRLQCKSRIHRGRIRRENCSGARSVER